MKKVICVDADGVILTQMKEYEVQELSYSLLRVKCDDGCVRDYPSIRFRPVPEQEFQYGQEVEYCGQKARYIGKSPTTKHGIIIIEIEHFEDKQELAYCQLSDIRPVQSMREKVVEVLNKDRIRPHVPISNEELADRIIELVKNEKI